MNTNNVNLALEITTAAFRVNTGRGRPQSNPQVTLDFSEAGSLLETHGEKLVRLATFHTLKAQLGVDAACVITEHPKTPGTYVLKTAAIGKVDVNVVIRPGAEPVVEAAPEASTEAPATDDATSTEV